MTAFLLLMAGKASATENKTVAQAGRDLGGGLYTIGAGWTEVPETMYKTGKNENPVSGMIFGPVEGTARGIRRMNEGLFRAGNLLLPTQEEIEKNGGLKKTFYF